MASQMSIEEQDPKKEQPVLGSLKFDTLDAYMTNATIQYGQKLLAFHILN